MGKKKLRVLVFYGGDAATNPRHELMAFLARDSLNVKAKLVAEDPPHSKGAVDDRVDEAIAQADKAIALLTPDSRSEYGAPNVMDEIGRWRGAKGKDTICIVRQQGVPVYSNHAGLVFVGFKERVKEAFDGIREFLLDESGKKKTGSSKTKASTNGDWIVDSSPNVALINGRRYVTSKIEEVQARLSVVATELDGEGEAALRNIESRRGAVRVAYGNRATELDVDDVGITHGKKVEATITGRIPEQRYSMMHEGSIGIGGMKSLSADEIATMRASRILSNDPPASKNTGADFLEMFIRGGSHGRDEVTESPIPRLLQQLPRKDRATWDIVRLQLLLDLRMSNTVEHIERLRLTIRRGRLVRVEFRGRRAKHYINHDPYVIELDLKVNF
jgi:hypothetical protein